jgi:hypothetical protein
MTPNQQPASDVQFVYNSASYDCIAQRGKMARAIQCVARWIPPYTIEFVDGSGSTVTITNSYVGMRFETMVQSVDVAAWVGCILEFE